MALTDLISYIAKALVDHPEEVVVDEVEGEQRDVDVIELTVAKDDLGKVIGKQGRTARALRSLLKVAATKQGQRASLEIL